MHSVMDDDLSRMYPASRPMTGGDRREPLWPCKDYCRGVQPVAPEPHVAVWTVFNDTAQKKMYSNDF